MLTFGSYTVIPVVVITASWRPGSMLWKASALAKAHVERFSFKTDYKFHLLSDTNLSETIHISPTFQFKQKWWPKLYYISLRNQLFLQQTYVNLLNFLLPKLIWISHKKLQ